MQRCLAPDYKSVSASPTTASLWSLHLGAFPCGLWDRVSINLGCILQQSGRDHWKKKALACTWCLLNSSYSVGFTSKKLMLWTCWSSICGFIGQNGIAGLEKKNHCTEQHQQLKSQNPCYYIHDTDSLSHIVPMHSLENTAQSIPFHFPMFVQVLAAAV